MVPSTTSWNEYPIEGSSYSLGWIVNVLKERNAIDFSQKDISEVSVSNINEGNGFVSQILRICTSLRSGTEYSVIFKVPDAKLIEEAFHGVVQDANSEYFNREIEFYQAFLRHLTIPLPRIYKTILWVSGEESGGLLMEDLSKSCHIQSVSDGLNLDQLRAIAGHLADLHNSFLSLPADERDMLSKNFAVLDKCIEFRTELFAAKVAELCEEHPEMFEKKLGSLIELLKDPNFHRYSSANLSETFGTPRVPVHGDLWSNNILWKNKNPAEVGAFLDWQGFFVGNLAFDLSRILVLCTSASIRRAHTEDVLLHYYASLQNPEFSMETLRILVLETIPYQCAHMIFVVRLLESSYTAKELEEMLDRVVCALDDVSSRKLMFYAK
ncbi:hypothetical protein QR680_013857 [Steinernema hermaphroditum]|uniref:CHK kinase-like domain-containing protein n=1 Tax=Steinernema hermaphroditum TaxID=289476 RepID=A0AA39I9P7_9BILA|nr:hypothetical protein QR680_013857 [Steinernema hermaphroditum]